ncbi:predicted protein [Streptomyces sp. C]|nr:predicted protein [Streptomyces sp. C]
MLPRLRDGRVHPARRRRLLVRGERVAMALERCLPRLRWAGGGVAGAAGASQARSVTGAPSAAPRTIGACPVAAHRTDRPRLLLRLVAGTASPGRFRRGPQRDPGQVDAGRLAAAHACPQVV